MNIDRNEKFIVITAEEGYVITDYKEDDILNYTSSTILYCPLNMDLSGYYEITVEKDEEYKRLQEQTINEMEKGAE